MIIQCWRNKNRVAFHLFSFNDLVQFINNTNMVCCTRQH